MMNPEMMRMATEMMSRMTPEQMAQMQRQMANMPPEMMQQAMNMAQNATPEQVAMMRQQMGSVPPETFASQASVAAEQFSQQQQYQYNAAAQLKAEGNRLHGSKLWREAAEKYERAISNLSGHASQQSCELRAVCQSNLASCFLQLGQWQQCAEMCATVLAADDNNRKALYRRGQALCALGQYDAAVQDLRLAVKLSPESEKDVIREKLAEAKQKLRQEAQGVHIEEVTEPAAADAAPAPAAAAAGAAAEPAAAPVQQQQQQEGLVEESETDEDMPGLEPAASAAAASSQPAPAPVPPASMGVPPVPAGAGVPPIPESMQPVAAAAAAAGGSQEEQMKAASEALRQNPEMMRQAASMLEGMSEEQLRSMTAMMPGAAGMQIDPAQMKMAAKMMSAMSPEDMERMQRMAASMQLGAGGSGGMAPAGAATAAAGAAVGGAAVGAGAVGGALPAAPAPGMPGMPAGFDASSIPADMMSNLRAQMQDPQMLKTMKSMLKGMGPEALADMMKASGMNMTPEQAESMVNKLDSVSDKQLEMIARLMGWVNSALAAYQRAKAWVMSQGALVLALLVLLLALLLRWMGWI